MIKNTTLLIIATLVLWVLTLGGAFFYSQQLHDTYGFLSKTSPLGYQATTQEDRLILDFSPQEKGLGIVELDIARQNHDQSGTLLATLTYEGGRKLISSETYTTTHVDSSKPLLMSFNSYAHLDTNEYRLTIQADPMSLLPSYLVQSGLQTRGVYFLDYAYLQQNPGEIIRLVEWKLADLRDTFTFTQLMFLLILPLLTPLAVYLAWYQYQERELRQLLIASVIYGLTRPLAWSKQFSQHTLLSAHHNRQVISSLYKKLFTSALKSIQTVTTRWYIGHEKMIWDGFFVIMWSLTNLVYAVTKIEITDPMYLWFAIGYLAFAACRRVDSRLHYLGALITLFFCPYYLSQGLEATAEKAAIFVYGFMVTGALFDAIELYRTRRGDIKH